MREYKLCCLCGKSLGIPKLDNLKAVCEQCIADGTLEKIFGRREDGLRDN